MVRTWELNVKEILYLKFRPGILSSCLCEFPLQTSASLFPWAPCFLYSCLRLYKLWALWDRNNYFSLIWLLTSLITASIMLPATNSISSLRISWRTRFQTLVLRLAGACWRLRAPRAPVPALLCPAGQRELRASQVATTAPVLHAGGLGSSDSCQRPLVGTATHTQGAQGCDLKRPV